MRYSTFDLFYDRLRPAARFSPREIQYELSYRCNLRCGHCYCQGLGSRVDELSAAQTKKVLDNMRRAGGFWLSLTGGEPLVREDFLEIYAHARKIGFLVSIFSNGLLWTDSVIRALKKSPPYSIEITVNGITRKTYEKITGVDGSFERFLERMEALFKSGLPVVIKSNLMKPNQAEIPAIKRWAQDNLGSPGGKYLFKYDTYVHPRLNGDKAPLRWRLPASAMEGVIFQDTEMARQFEDHLAGAFPPLERPGDCLYQCSSWQDRVFIDPRGQARFCLFSDAYSFDARQGRILERMRRVFSKIPEKKFNAASACRDCLWRPICQWCPAKARLETGDPQKRTAYYCRMTRHIARRTGMIMKRNRDGVS